MGIRPAIVFAMLAFTCIAGEVTYKDVKYKQIEFKLLKSYEPKIKNPLYCEISEIKILNEGLPANIKMLGGKTVTVDGFLYPIRLNPKGFVTEFLIVSDQQACCFGQFPIISGWIYVKDKKGLNIKPDIPLRFYGTLEVGGKANDDEIVTLYRLVNVQAHEVKEK